MVQLQLLVSHKEALCRTLKFDSRVEIKPVFPGLPTVCHFLINESSIVVLKILLYANDNLEMFKRRNRDKKLRCLLGQEREKDSRGSNYDEGRKCFVGLELLQAIPRKSYYTVTVVKK